MRGIPTPESPSAGPSSLAELSELLADLVGDRRRAIAELAESLAQRLGFTLVGSGFALIDESSPVGQLAFADVLVSPATLGQVHELLLADDERRADGAHYTPPELAAGLVEAALAGWLSTPDTTVLDPSCGGGAFLLAAASALAERHGVSRRAVAANLRARDIDPLAVAVAELSIALWCLEGGEQAEPLADFLPGDSLRDELPPTDLIVGNPPFLSQLASATARSDAARQAVRARFGDRAGPYADSAAYFVIACGEALQPNGRMVLIQPQSLLSSRDVVEVRRWASTELRLSGLWYCAEPVFAASVRVCAPVIDRCPHPTADIARWFGTNVTATTPIAATDVALGAESWGPLVADLLGIPGVPAFVGSSDTLGSLATATAGFRDQFYGFAPHTFETDSEPTSSTPAAVTVGMVDALRLRWGTDEFRYAGIKWQRPAVDLQAVAAEDPSLRGWAADRLHPKVLLATQTKVIEVVVDVEGTLLPITPLIAIEPIEPGENGLWKLAAMLSSPAVSAWALTQRVGTALSVQALKLAARDVIQIPVPTDRAAWEAGADLARSAQFATTADAWAEQMAEFGQTMGNAYGPADPDLIDWWWKRLPGWR